MTFNGSGDQWGWDDMEELLQCPVCFEPPTNGIVEQCKSGHHICSDCKSKVENCPLCKCSYTGTRNFVVEELMRNLEVLKNIMLLNALATQSKAVKTSKSKEVLRVITKPKTSLPPAPDSTKGTYPCVLRCCSEILSSSRLLNHVRSLHSKLYCEGSLDNRGTFTVTFSVPTNTALPLYKWQKVLFISGIGLVYFTYVLFRSSYLVATVQMAAKDQVAQKFKCILHLTNTQGADYKHVLKLISTREKMENILYGEKCMLLSKSHTKFLRRESKVNCTLQFSAVKANDLFGSHYPRLETDYFKDILLYYKTYDQNNALPKVCRGFNVVL